ncbi:hypothetical protein GQ53DRAFT_429979 [Thozetella sp. PMI_491]|nr:hypothetical protein GQ53DRAFT_429979 [Thozetella sp. PMI_491]
MPQYIYINGFPGVGKLTIAKELESLIPDSKIYHNHLIIDPIAPLISRNSPDYVSIRTGLRRHILDIISTAEETKHTTWIFTDCRTADSVGAEAAGDYKTASHQRGVPFISVVLICDVEENAQRMAGRVRGVETSTKLADLDVLRTIRKEMQLYTFGEPDELQLDVTQLTAAEAARHILEHIAKVVGASS